MRGRPDGTPGKTLSHTDTMRTIEQTFQQLTALISDQTRDLALAMAELRAVEAERDTARQSLRAVEQDCDDMQSINSDLRTVNARLIAERDAAMERLNHAESIIMQ